MLNRIYTTILIFNMCKETLVIILVVKTIAMIIIIVILWNFAFRYPGKSKLLI